MKKIVSLILVICLFAGLSSGCSLKRINADEDIINMQFGGYLYTSQVRAETKDERDMLKAREKAVASMINNLEDAANHSFSLTDAFSKYEDNLIKYMEKIENSESAGTLLNILEKITAYKTVLESYEEQIRQYMKMKPETQAAEAIINTYKLDTICSLVNIQNEYASWLKVITASTAGFLEKDNQRQADKLISTSASIYVKQISKNLSASLEDYEAGAFMNSVISSADYYAARVYLDRTNEVINEMKNGDSKVSVSADDISEIEAMYNEAADSIVIPDNLMPAPEEKESFSFTRTVSAAEENPEDFSTSAYMLDFYTDNRPEKTIPDPMLPVEDTLLEEELTELKYDINQTPEKAAASVDSTPPPAAQTSEDAGLFSSITNKISDAKSAGAAFLNTLAEASLPTIIRIAQATIKNSNPDLDSQYTSIIKKLASLLANGENIQATNQTQSVLNLLQVDLEKMIGENKQAFVDFILNSKADVLLEAFDNWKENLKDGDKHIYTRNDLIDLLGLMGIKAEAIDTDSDNPVVQEPVETSQTAKPSVTPSSSPEPTGADDPPDSNEDLDNYNVAHITGLWQTIRETSPTIENAAMLYTIYGWTDLLDYNAYEKSETYDKNNKLIKIQYLDGSNPVGWETRLNDDYLTYKYRFPDTNDVGIEILRYNIDGGSYIFEIKTYNDIDDRETAVRFRDPSDDSESEPITYIVQRQSGKRDGLNTTGYNSLPTYAIYEMEEIVESYTFKEGQLFRELTSSGTGSSLFTHITIYHSNGNVSRDYTELNGEEHGLYSVFYENGEQEMTVEYTNGKYNGALKHFFDDGSDYTLVTYVDGIKDGPTYKYYSGGDRHLRYEGFYKDNKSDGLWKSYTQEGILSTEVEYKEDMKDGVYKDYATGNTSSSSIHAYGQYSNDQKTGEWIYGYNNEGWVEKVFYDEGIKVWDEKVDSQIRTYYNPDGSVSHTEDKP